MRIGSVSIRNFMALRQLDIDSLPDLVILAGPNGSGKSSFFSAIRVFKEAVAGYSFHEQFYSDTHTIFEEIGNPISFGTSEARISVTFVASDEEREELGLPSDHDGRLMASVVVVQQGRVGRYATQVEDPLEQLTPLRKLLSGGILAGSRIGIIDHIGPQREFNPAEVTNLQFTRQFTEEWARRLISDTAAKFQNLRRDIIMMKMLDLQDLANNAAEPLGYIAGIRRVFEHFIPEVEFVDVVLPQQYDFAPRIVVRIQGEEADIKALSSGQKEILMTYTHLERMRPTSSVILFDEPELHLHPMLQRRVVAHIDSLLDRGENQFFIATHSEEIIGSASYENLFHMTGDPQEPMRPVAERPERLELLRQLGANVGVQLTAPLIVLLEGESDAEFLPHFIGELPLGVVLCETGGKGTLMRLSEAALRVLEDVIREGRIIVVRDQDVEDDPVAVGALAQKHPDRFFIWDRYHIENYLLDADAIESVFSTDAALQRHADSAEIETRLRAIADRQQQLAVAKRVESYANGVLRKRVVLNPQVALDAAIDAAIDKRVAEITTMLGAEALRNAVEQIRSDVEAAWDNDWKHLCVGRAVLKEYHKQYVRTDLGYDVFCRKIASRIRERGTLPEAIARVRDAINAVN